jgi:hypothetical protein
LLKCIADKRPFNSQPSENKPTWKFRVQTGWAQ